ALSLALIILGLAAGWLWWSNKQRRRRSSRRGRTAERLSSFEAPMALWSAQIRDALIVRFGPAWGAKTTEEIAAEPALAAALGPEGAEQLVRFLHEADRARFAGTEAAAAHGPEWAAWVAAFVAEAGARSRSNGR